MICTNCYKEEYKAAKAELPVTINGEARILGDLDCEKCPDCGDINFTHAQSLEIDKKRIALEFGLKPLLTPLQLRTLRRVLNMKLDEICDLLHIGRNTYGRWERGEVEITPSMNLLVHNLIEKIPDARVQIFDDRRVIKMAKPKVTGAKAATSASKTLTRSNTASKSKSAAGSALSQTSAPKKVTSPKAATSASKVLSDGRTSKNSKSAAGSALAQKPAKGKR